MVTDHRISSDTVWLLDLVSRASTTSPLVDHLGTDEKWRNLVWLRFDDDDIVSPERVLDAVRDYIRNYFMKQDTI